MQPKILTHILPLRLSKEIYTQETMAKTRNALAGFESNSHLEEKAEPRPRGSEQWLCL